MTGWTGRALFHSNSGARDGEFDLVDPLEHLEVVLVLFLVTSDEVELQPIDSLLGFNPIAFKDGDSLVLPTLPDEDRGNHSTGTKGSNKLKNFD